MHTADEKQMSYGETTARFTFPNNLPNQAWSTPTLFRNTFELLFSSFWFVSIHIEILIIVSLSGGELLDRVIDPDYRLTEAEVVNYIRQLCDGLQHMHEQNIVHLDIKVSSSQSYRVRVWSMRIFPFTGETCLQCLVAIGQLSVHRNFIRGSFWGRNFYWPHLILLTPPTLWNGVFVTRH